MKIRLILMFEGKVEYDFETKINQKPKFKETISIKKENESIHYRIVEIQHFFNEQGEFKYIMITGRRKY
jgi:hypothetical protein